MNRFFGLLKLHNTSSIYIYMSIIMIIGAVSRAYFLSSPMGYDESYTFLHFVNQDISQLFYYPLPNNHVFHSILVKISTAIWGASPVSIRFPAFFAGLLIILFTFLLGKKIANERVGLLAALMMTISPYIIHYSTHARGYTIMILLGLLLSIESLSYIEKPTIKRLFFISIIASIGMLTMPSMLFLIAGIYTWIIFLLIKNKQSIKNIFINFVLPATFFTAFFTIVFYIPVIIESNGIDTILSNRFVTSEPWNIFINKVIPHLKGTFSHFNGNIPNIVVYSGLISLIVGLFASQKEKKWELFFLLISLLLGAGVIFVLKHKIPFSRTWIYLLPFIYIVAGYGIDYIVNKISAKLYILLIPIFIF